MMCCFDSIPFVDVQVPLEQEETEILQASPVRKILGKIRPEWHLDNCKIEMFTNGITNKIFSIEQNGHKLVFRVFGEGTEQLVDRHSELRTFQRLAKAGLAPPVFARFQNGLVCGFVPGKCLSIRSVRDPLVVDKISHTMALMHKIPLGKDDPQESVSSVKLKKFLASLPREFASVQSQAIFDEYFAGMDLEGQFSRLQCSIAKMKCPLVFCHNDLLIFNILLDESADKVHFIDYEYAGPNHQLFDIANHFCEYAGVEDPDFERDGPTDPERRHFLTRYFFHFRNEQLDERQLDELLWQTSHFEAESHFFWTIWAIHQANLSQIQFDYMGYAVIRHRQFVRIAAQLGI